MLGKKGRRDVLEFESNLEEQLFSLHADLVSGLYVHGGYTSFFVRDPKPRRIHKASVRDRLLHHAIHRVLYKHFDRRFIFDSYSSRENKGTHSAIKRFRDYAWRISRNQTRTVWVLKVDVKKFFASIDHHVLTAILEQALTHEPDPLLILGNIIASYQTTAGRGIPLDNLTSQLFSNVYLNLLDQYAKRDLKLRDYLRYADDIFVLSSNKTFLRQALVGLRQFIEDKLKLVLNPDKISLRPWHVGVDILGFVSYPARTIVRPVTERRMFKRLMDVFPTGLNAQENALYSRVKFEREC